MLFDAGGHNLWTNFETAWFLYAWKGSEKEVSQCNVFFMERQDMSRPSDVWNFRLQSIILFGNSLVN